MAPVHKLTNLNYNSARGGILENTCGSTDSLGIRSPFRYIFPARISVGVFLFHLYMSISTTLSPRRHLLGVGKREEACLVIAQLNSVPVDDPLVDEYVDELQYAIDVENEGGKPTWLECFSPVNGLWKRTVNGMMLQFLQQLNGQNFYCKLQWPMQIEA